MKSPLEIAKLALHKLALDAPVSEMATAVEALRLLHERPDTAELLFRTEQDVAPPTDKQIRYLRALGCRGEIVSKREASSLIFQYREKRGHTRKEKGVRR